MGNYEYGVFLCYAYLVAGQLLVLYSKLFGMQRHKIKEKNTVGKDKSAVQAAGGRWSVTHYTLQTVIV
ncbi:MAG TPA: hypothetical protein VIH57_21780 [Bacteroidales bacterium]